MLSAAEAERRIGISPVRVSRWSVTLKEPALYRVREKPPEKSRFGPIKPAALEGETAA
jgi:hypothetical protein